MRLIASRRWLLLSVLALAVPVNPVAADAFTVGNLAVIQVSTDNSVALREFTSTGSAVQSIAVPATGGGALTMGLGSTSEGSLSLSPDGRYLGFAGYRTGTSGGTTDRVIARVDLTTGSPGVDPTIDTTTSIAATEGYGGNSIRGAVWNAGGGRYWAAGAGTGGGTRTNTLGSTAGSVLVSATPNNTRVANIVNGQLFVSSMSGSNRGVNTVGSGLPETAGQTTSLLPGFSPATDSLQNSYGFVFTNANTLYIADDRNTVGLGGIQKWTFDGSVWSLQYTGLLGTAGVAGAGARGLVHYGNGQFIASSNEGSANRLVSITDTGAGFSTFATLATAGAGTAFRGISIVPEPSSILLGGAVAAGFAGAAVRRFRRRAVVA